MPSIRPVTRRISLVGFPVFLQLLSAESNYVGDMDAVRWSLSYSVSSLGFNWAGDSAGKTSASFISTAFSSSALNLIVPPIWTFQPLLPVSPRIQTEPLSSSNCAVLNAAGSAKLIFILILPRILILNAISDKSGTSDKSPASLSSDSCPRTLPLDPADFRDGRILMSSKSI